MDNQDNTEEAKKLLQNYLAGNCTPEEERQVLRWYYSFRHEANLNLDKINEDAILKTVKHDLLRSIKKNHHSRLLQSNWFRIAAILLIVFIATLTGIRHYSKPGLPPVNYSEIITARGERKELLLPDGSSVTLNAASKIRIPSNFGAVNRTVELAGEAFFKVVHNAAKPFWVKTGKLITKDVGTSFDIKAYSDENDIQIAVLTGEVSIGCAAGMKHEQLSATLHPDEMLDYHLVNNTHLVKKINASHITGWKNDEFYFDAVSIPEIAGILSRRYNLDISVLGARNSNCLYTMKFGNEPIAKALDILTNLSGTSWQLNNHHQIIINAQNCK